MNDLQGVALCPWCEKPFIKKDVRQRFCNRNHSSYYSRREKQKREKAEASIVAERKAMEARQEQERIEALEAQISKGLEVLRGFAPRTAKGFQSFRENNGPDCAIFALKLTLTALHEVQPVRAETARPTETTV